MLSAKWATFDRYGSPMPDWDQWDAEAVETLIPWFTNDHFLQHLFNPHNEHRVVLTKLQNLALVLLNGQWDSRLEAVTNAALHSALAAAFFLLGLRCLRDSSEQRAGRNEHPPIEPAPTPTRYPLLATRYFFSPVLFLLTFALFGLPTAWQNVLGGFHSQQYWLAALSFAAIVTLPFARPWRAAWWLGAVSGILALGSMGSGFLAAVAVLLALAFRLTRRESTLRDTWPTVALCLALVIVGVLTRHEVPWHQDMKAKSIHDFVFSIVHSLQWPWRDQHWAALVLWLPWLLLAVQVLTKTQSPGPQTQNSKPKTQNSAWLAQATLALGGWVLLQLAATAYARGAGADYPASRYMDTLTFGAMANAVALCWLLSSQRSREQGAGSKRSPATPPSSASVPPRPLLPAPFSLLLALAWLLTLSLGLHRYLAQTVRWELDSAKEYYTKAEGHMRRYLATNDPQHLAHKDIPFPSAEGLVERLAVPSLRALMPVPLRTPLPLSPAPSDSSVPSVLSVPSVPSPAPAFTANTAIGHNLINPPHTGLSPRTPPLDYTTTWGSFSSTDGMIATGSWRSAPITPVLRGWLKFEVAGTFEPQDGGRPVALGLHDAATGDFIASVIPSRNPGDVWRSAYVRTPDRPFTIGASDLSARGWLAFSPPVEMAPLSYWAWQATKHALLILYVVAGITCALSLLALKVGTGGPPVRSSDRPSASQP